MNNSTRKLVITSNRTPLKIQINLSVNKPGSPTKITVPQLKAAFESNDKHSLHELAKQIDVNSSSEVIETVKIKIVVPKGACCTHKEQEDEIQQQNLDSSSVYLTPENSFNVVQEETVPVTESQPKNLAPLKPPRKFSSTPVKLKTDQDSFHFPNNIFSPIKFPEYQTVSIPNNFFPSLEENSKYTNDSKIIEELVLERFGRSLEKFKNKKKSFSFKEELTIDNLEKPKDIEPRLEEMDKVSERPESRSGSIEEFDSEKFLRGIIERSSEEHLPIYENICDVSISTGRISELISMVSQQTEEIVAQKDIVKRHRWPGKMLHKFKHFLKCSKNLGRSRSSVFLSKNLRNGRSRVK